MKKKIWKLVILTACMSASLSAQNLIRNGDFEKGTSNWSLFAPADAKEHKSGLAVSSQGAHAGTNCAVLSSAGPARYGMVNYVAGHRFAPGQRFRVTAWVKAGEDFEPVAGTPGFLIRVTMFASASGWESATDGMFYLGAGDKTVRGKETGGFNNQAIPTEWTKVEGVFEASPDTAKMNVSVFVWKGSGSFYVDDVTLELLEGSTPAAAQAAN